MKRITLISGKPEAIEKYVKENDIDVTHRSVECNVHHSMRKILARQLCKSETQLVIVTQSHEFIRLFIDVTADEGIEDEFVFLRPEIIERTGKLVVHDFGWEKLNNFIKSGLEVR